MGFIYKVTSPSSKIYIGQTRRDPRRRWMEHCWSKDCTALKNAITKYGTENMKFEVVEECAVAMLNDREQHWIRELNTLAPNGYNLRSGGGVGESVSDESREKMSAKKQQFAIDKNGYIGHIHEGRGYISAVAPDRSNLGSYATREEAEEVLREYTRDPENFVPKLSKRKHGTGGVSSRCDSSGRVRWVSETTQNKKHKYLGYYKTKEEAEIACVRYLENPQGFTVPPREIRRRGTGCIHKTKNGKRWEAVYKSKYVGTFDTEAQAEAAIRERVEETKI